MANASFHTGWNTKRKDSEKKQQENERSRLNCFDLVLADGGGDSGNGEADILPSTDMALNAGA